MASKFFSFVSKTVSCHNDIVCMNAFLRGLERLGQNIIVLIQGK